METVGEGVFEELKALDDLLGGVNVERSAIFGGEGGEICSVAVERAVAIDERAWICRCGCDIF